MSFQPFTAPSLPQVQVRIPIAGIPLINGTQTFASWTAPNDGQSHSVIVSCTELITSNATGGALGYTFTDPAGNVHTNFQILGGAQAAGVHLLGFPTVEIAPGSTFSFVQTSPLSLGAGIIFGSILAS